jgi:predicted DCC family thiol-disulfide oxidoreductase YuxK
MKPLLLYDGDCGICSVLIRWARQVDRHHRYDLQPYQSFPAQLKQAYGLSDQQFERGLYWVNPANRRVYHGAFAINRFFLSFFPYNLGIILLYLCPLFLLAELVIYAVIAKYRSPISRWLGLNRCSIKRP